MNTSDQQVLYEDTLRELGRFVVRFSHVLYALENSTIFLIGIGGSSIVPLRAALSDRTAGPIVSSFFSVFHTRWAEALTEGDKKILSCLRRELDSLIKERNRLMHDVWLITTVGGDLGPHPLARSRLRAHGAGAEYETASYRSEDLEKISADAARLAEVVRSSAFYKRVGQQGPELERRFEIVEKKVLRRSTR